MVRNTGASLEKACDSLMNFVIASRPDLVLRRIGRDKVREAV